MKTYTAIEALESRIAPAAVFTFTDVDGDAVTVKTTKGNNADLTAAISTAAAGVGNQLRKIDFSMNAAVFAGTDLIISVVKKPGGDGFVNVGHIDASDADGMGAKLDLGKIVIPGDLGQVDAGDTDSNTPAIKSLSVRSIGALGLATQGGGGQLQSSINGGVGSIAVKGDIRDALIIFTNNGAGTEALSKIGTLTIGGSLVGGALGGSGFIKDPAFIGKITIGGSIIGGLGTDSGSIEAGEIGSIAVRGNITGGDGSGSGSLTVIGNLKTVAIGGSIVGAGGSGSGVVRIDGSGATAAKVGGDISGGVGSFTGTISTNGTYSSLSIGGNIAGGDGTFSGRVYADFGAGAVKVLGSIVGGNVSPTSGTLEAFGNVKSVFIGGSIIGGDQSTTGYLTVISAGSITVKGSIVGGSSGGSGVLRVGDANSIVVGGSIIGGSVTSGSSNIFSGVIQNVTGTVKSIVVGGSLIGGSVSGSGSLLHTGSISAENVLSVVVKGSLIAGNDVSSGTLRMSGSINAEESLGSVKILGGVTGSATHRATISAAGPGTAPAGSAVELAIAKLAIGGSVAHADILAGYDEGSEEDGDASIGTVLVKGDWLASNIVAGVKDVSADGFGDSDDAVSTVDNDPAITSRIASIVIGGSVGGSFLAGDSFGFVAQQIGSVKIGGSTVFTGTAATDSAKLLPTVNNDVSIREVA